MSKNYFSDVAKILGVDFEEEFYIKGYTNLSFKFSERGLVWWRHDKWARDKEGFLFSLLTGQTEIIKKPTPDEQQEKYLAYVREKLDHRTLLEQLAEEAAELAQAALKSIRAHKMNDNATPITEDEARNKILEELIDVLIVIHALKFVDVKYIAKVMPSSTKWRRWAKRLGYTETEGE